jgi:O-antigen/teichoic acid export membrane protein
MKTESSSFIPTPDRRPPTLASDFSWTLLGNAVYAGAQFAVLMLLAKLLRPEMVGQYALGLALVYPVMMFTNLQLRAVLSSDTTEKVAFGHYLGLRLVMTALAFVSVFVMAQILGYDRQLTAVVLMVGVAYGIETISDVFYARLQLHDRMAEIAKSMMARAALSVLALCLVTYLTRNVLWGIAGIAVARAIVLFGYDISRRTQGLPSRSKHFLGGVLTPRFDWAIQRKIAWVSLPLGIVVLLGCLNSSIPNFFIKSALGEREVGMFAAIGFVVSVGNMAVVSLGQSAFTRLARSYAAGNHRAFGSLLAKLLAFGALLGLCGMVVSKFAGRQILTILFHPEYAQRADLLPWIMAAGGVLFMAQFLGFGLTAANFYHSQVVLNAVAIFSLLLGCWWLVPQRGLLGAILAMLIAATVQLIGSLVVLLRGMTVKLQIPMCSERAETV